MHRGSVELMQILSDLRAGRVDGDEARARIESSPGFHFPKSEFVLSYLDHYLDDEAIRKSDSSYRTMQDRELDKLISRLEKADYEGAAEVSFLRIS